MYKDGKNLTPQDYIIYLDFIHEKGKEYFEEVRKQNLERIVAKKLVQFMKLEKGQNWIKVKAIKTIDCVVIGYTSVKKEINALI